MSIDRENQYTFTAIVIHWVSAVSIFAMFAIGWYMVELPQGPERSSSFALHKSIGLTIFLVAILRVTWRHFHRPPPYRHLPKWRITLARSAHLLFYVLLVVQPASGYLSSSFSGYKTRLFGIALPHWGWRDAPLNEFFTEIHVLSSVLFLGLICAHLAGALSHAFSREDGVLRRMRPW